MADQPPSSPAVRLQVRFGSAPPTWHDVVADAFLIGSVPGCDLRLPGARLPPVLAVISRGPNGVVLRRLVPVQPILLNGHSIAAASLENGDVITVNSTELLVQVAGLPQAAPTPHPAEEDLIRREAEVARQEQEMTQVRQDLVNLRQQIDEQYRGRRDRLTALQAAVRRAARKVRDRKLQLEDEAVRSSVQHQEEVGLASELIRAGDLMAQEKQKLDEQRQLLDAWHQDMEDDLGERLRQLEQREREAVEKLKSAERVQAQLQTDLLHLSRREAAIETKQQQLQTSARAVDHRYERLQRDSRDLEEQAVELDGWHNQLTEDQQRLDQQRAELAKTASEVHQRAASLEGQQAMLASLRSRVERLRDEARRAEQELADQRHRQETLEGDLNNRLRDLQQREREVEAERQLQEQERRRFEDRQKVLEAAVAQLRQAQDALEAEESRLLVQKHSIAAAAATQTEETALAQARFVQVAELQKRLEADRQALSDREVVLTQAEQTMTALQEQLRRRSDDLAARQKALAEQSRQLGGETAALEQARQEVVAAEQQLDQHRQRLEETLAGRTAALEQRQAEHEARAQELTRRDETIRRHVEQLKEAGRHLDAERQRLEDEHLRKQAEQTAAGEGLTAARSELDEVRRAALEMQRQLPDLEGRAREAAQRLEQAREQWREHLAEEHAFAVQSREDLDRLHAQSQIEAERLRQQEAELHRARADHRLAVAAFRQQLIEWQSQVGEMRLAMAQDSTRLERRQAEVEEQARQVETAGARLAEQAEQLEIQERQVAEKHDELKGHLDDMREWYRQKLRELVGVNEDGDGPVDEAGVAASPPIDRQLGELLRSLGLVDDATLAALLAEARRQRRSLRQLLLSGGYLTLYQMALIEAGNVAALVLGPVRVVDRLRATPREAVYLVYDPRSDRKAVLRHLSEAESADAVRPDEFRQRFAAAAALRHPNLAATLEVLEVAGRPAVLQESLQGLPATDWPAYTNVPGVWYRLMTQAALALHTAHSAGLIHDRLGLGSFVLTTDGTLKLCGIGEPDWLASANDDAEAGSSDGSVARDLTALGRIAETWASAAPEGSRKGSKPRPLPEALQRIVRRLTTENMEQMFGSAAELLADLERAGEEVPANAAAWDRLVRSIREQIGESNLRLSA